MYDLYGVSNHIMFQSYGGHYTSYLQVEPSDMQGSKKLQGDFWYKCDDSHISKMEKEKVVSKQAYTLFFKKKEFTASNIINLSHPW